MNLPFWLGLLSLRGGIRGSPRGGIRGSWRRLCPSCSWRRLLPCQLRDRLLLLVQLPLLVYHGLHQLDVLRHQLLHVGLRRPDHRTLADVPDRDRRCSLCRDAFKGPRRQRVFLLRTGRRVLQGQHVEVGAGRLLVSRNLERQDDLERQVRTEELREKLKDPYATFMDDDMPSNPDKPQAPPEGPPELTQNSGEDQAAGTATGEVDTSAQSSDDSQPPADNNRPS